MEPPCRIAEHLVKVPHGQIVIADMPKRRPRRGIDAQPGILAKFADAEQMRSITDHNDGIEIIFPGYGSQSVDLLFSIGGTGLRNDISKGNAIGQQIIPANPAFGVAGVLIASASKSDDQWGDLPAIELDRVIETGMEHRRRTSGILRSAKYGDSIGGLSLVLTGHIGYLLIHPDKPAQRNQQKYRQ